jgi:signal transduction histidine kinase
MNIRRHALPKRMSLPFLTTSRRLHRRAIAVKSAGVLIRLLVLILLPLVAFSQDVLTSAQAVRELDRKAAAKEPAVRVTGVVTFVTPPGGSFIVDDGKTGIYVAFTDVATRGWPPPEKNFEGDVVPGMLVEVSGVASPGGFAPVIVPKSIQQRGTAPFPPMKPVSVVELQTGRLDCERVKVRGVVQHVDFGARPIDAVRLELAGAGGHFVGYALKPEGFDPKKLVDAEVDLSGVALSFFNERGEILGARVQIHGIDDVQVVRPAPESAFAVPEVALDALLPFSSDPPVLHRRRITGTVTVCRPGAFFYVQEGDRAVRVSTRDTTLLAPGDRVEVSGFVELAQYFAEVREAVFRKTGTGSVPAAEPVTHARVLERKAPMPPTRNASHLDGRRVVLRGRLEKMEGSDGAGRRLSLDCDGHLVFATLVNAEPAETSQRLELGSEISVTGVCQVQLSAGKPTSTVPVPTDFQLLVHSARDVKVLGVPPWWTPERLWLALGGTGAVLALALGWVWLLRRRVAQRGAQLAAEIGSRRNAALEFDATLRERKRLAADLHDTLEQALTGLALQLEAVDLFRSEAPERSTHHLHLARQFLARSREDVRRSVWNLRAQGLEGRTLSEALREMLAALTQAALTRGQAVRCACEVEGTAVALPDFIAGNLLLLAQEAVTNALKHARARTIVVRVIFGADGVTLSVEDDGEGFEVSAAPGLKEGHFGLQGMRERVKRLDGTIEIESEKGKGTRIAARVPTGAFDRVVEGL